MKNLIAVVILGACFSLSSFAQNEIPQAYTEWVRKGSEFYFAKKYRESGEAYAKAFEAFGGKGYPDDRYDAACSWAEAGMNDSAFVQLEKIANRGNYTELFHLINDEDLVSLHTDKRWQEVCTKVKDNKDKAEVGLITPVVHILDTVYMDDQTDRQKIEDVQQKYGYDSKEIKALWKRINYKDSIDLIKVKQILDEYGWLGADKIGASANSTIFLVVQHADLKTQEKYLPMMREAVKKGNAQPYALALLEDRVALREGKKQIYGSQIQGDNKGNYWVSPLEDPDNVDKRRAEMQLQALADYVKQWHIVWNVEQYKKDLPEIEKKDSWKE